MMRGGTPRAFCAGIWNCTYIWPIMIWFGVNVWFGLFGAGSVAYSVTFGTPPMKKLPWSSITSGLVKNLFILLPFSPREVTAVETSRIRQRTKQCRRFMESSSLLASGPPAGSLRYTRHLRLRPIGLALRVAPLYNRPVPPRLHFFLQCEYVQCRTTLEP